MPSSHISMINLIAVAVGGALGSVLRYGVMLASARIIVSDFPYATLFVNALGSFVMGFVAALVLVKTQTIEPMRLFLTIGLLGGFTTFSTFSLDAVRLFEKGQIGAGAFYVGGSVIIAISALLIGMIVGRALV